MISSDQHFYTQIVDGSGHPLSGVLVSLSGANFRSNNFSKEDGMLDYHGLVNEVIYVITVLEHCLYPSLCSFVYGVNSLQNPGQYFIKPLLREFEFSPASKVPEPCLLCHKYLLCIVYIISHLGSRGKRRP